MPTREDALHLVAAGDAIITRKLRTFEHDGFDRLVDIVRSADAGFLNLEVLLHDYEGYPTGTRTGTYMRAPPWAVDELTWAGFNLFAAGVNHSFDYSHGGMEATLRELDRRNLTYAGLGRNLAEAREPAYLDTPGGRVGLVAACATLPTPAMIAGEQRRDMHGRPGVSPLRTSPRYVVPPEELDHLNRISDGLGLEDIKRERAGSSYSFESPFEDEAETFDFVNVTFDDNLVFESGEEFGVYRKLHTEDVSEITGQIDVARRQSDWVVASLHAHEGANGRRSDETTGAFNESFAKSCIDAGADVFVGHGPHRIRGIEVYDGCPIFYSLGNFIGQNQHITRLPAEIYDRYGLDSDATPADVFDVRVYDDDGAPAGFLADPTWWESIIPVCEFKGGELDSLEIYPVDLLREEPRPRRGRPVIATGERAESTLARLADLSEQFGTEMAIENGVGFVDL